MMETVRARKRVKPGAETAERIVEAAGDLFFLRGYQGTSLDMVAQAADVNRGSLYYFFRSKKKLALAVIDHFERLLHIHYLDPAFRGPLTGKQKLAALAARYARMPSCDSPCCGCPIGKLSLELSGIDEDLRLRFREVWSEAIRKIEGAVRQAVEEGLLRPEGDLNDVARAFFEQIQGAHLIARATLDDAALERDCRRAFENLSWIN